MSSLCLGKNHLVATNVGIMALETTTPIRTEYCTWSM